jgi:hypothetical protein
VWCGGGEEARAARWKGFDRQRTQLHRPPRRSRRDAAPGTPPVSRPRRAPAGLGSCRSKTSVRRCAPRDRPRSDSLRSSASLCAVLLA